MTKETLPEHQRARQWRESAGLSRAQLAKLSGYSISSIQDHERGTLSTGLPVPAKTMQRYRLACAAISSGLHRFDWDRQPRRTA